MAASAAEQLLVALEDADVIAPLSAASDYTTVIGQLRALEAEGWRFVSPGGDAQPPGALEQLLEEALAALQKRPVGTDPNSIILDHRWLPARTWRSTQHESPW